MAVTLQRIPASEFSSWLARSRNEYAGDLVTQGHSREDALSLAIESMNRSFPNSVLSPGNEVFHVVHQNEIVGYLWIGRDLSADPGAWWIWDIVIDADQRGRGFGKAAMLLGEQFARAHGADSLGLSVFGFNSGAQRLYESLGYETTSVKMRKKLC